MLEFGKEFEDKYAKHLINKNWFVIPKYLFSEEGSPLLLGKIKSYALPDLDISKNGKRMWVECKRKNKMKFHPATGYPKRNHIAYKEIQKITGNNVFIVFNDESLGKIYGNWLTELDKEIYKDNWFFNGIEHITFKYPEAFIFLETL